jgi:hypothetical protein
MCLSAFTQCLEHRGWTVHSQLEHPLQSQATSLEDHSGSEEERKEHLMKLLQELPAEKKALIIRNSHMGGHKYAGNCIVCTISFRCRLSIVLPAAIDIHPSGIRDMVWSCFTARG